MYATVLLAITVLSTIAGGTQDASTQTAERWTVDPVNAPGVEYVEFQSELAKTAVSVHVWLPPGYVADPQRRYPVLYWLHGSGGGASGVRPLSVEFARAVESGEVPPLIVVFPHGLPRSLWCDAVDGHRPVESVLVREIVPLIDARYRTLPAGEHRVIEGFSMGGYGAARIGFAHNDVFGAISILAGGPLQKDFTYSPRATPQERERVLRDVFSGDLANFRRLSPWQLAEDRAAELKQRKTLIRQVIGEEDNTLPANRAFHERLKALGIEHEYVELPGIGHDPRPMLRDDAAGRAAFLRKALSRPRRS